MQMDAIGSRRKPMEVKKANGNERKPTKVQFNSILFGQRKD